MTKKVSSRAGAKARAQRDQLLLIGGSIVGAVALVLIIGLVLGQKGIDITNLFGGTPPTADPANSYATVPQSTTAEGAPTLGNPEAKVVLMEFADFSCVHCADYHDTIKQVIDTYVRPGQVRFIFQTMTFVGRQYSEYAGQAALCAGQQTRFWDMQDALYKLQLAQTAGAFNAAGITGVANNLRLDTPRLMACINSGQTKQALDSGAALATKMSVTGTPTLFISTDGGKTFDHLTDSTGQPISSGGPTFETISQNIQKASQATSQ